MDNLPVQSPQAASSQPATHNEASADKAFSKLAEQVAERVWQLWREELRHNRERRGSRAGR